MKIEAMRVRPPGDVRLHGLRDRRDDPSGLVAAPHALDVDRIVAVPSRDEYDLVAGPSREHANAEPVAGAGRIVADLFGDLSSIGVR